MKKTSAILVISLIVALIFVLVACGNNTKNDLNNDMTTIKNDATSIMDGISSAASNLDSSLTADGNVTKENSSTGLFEDMTSDKNTTKNHTTETTSGSFATTSATTNP